MLATLTRRLCTIAGFYRYAVEEEEVYGGSGSRASPGATPAAASSCPHPRSPGRGVLLPQRGAHIHEDMTAQGN